MEDEKQHRFKPVKASSHSRQPCLSCGRPMQRPRQRGARFCSACLERSQMKNIDALYDDIGEPG